MAQDKDLIQNPPPSKHKHGFKRAQPAIFLRTARSFYGSLWYLRTYVQAIFRRSHPTLKLIKQKMSKILQVNVPNFFYFAEIQKMTKLGPKNRFWDLKIKINLSGIRPNLHPSFFEIQTWYFTSWFIATFSTLFDFIMYSLKVFLQVRLNLQSSTKVSNLSTKISQER